LEAARRTGTPSPYRRETSPSSPTGPCGRSPAPRRALFAVLGLRVDPARNLLWALTVAPPTVKDARPDDQGHAAVIAIDLTTGRAALEPFAGPFEGPTASPPTAPHTRAS
jgi:hypothetical protein